MQASAEVGQQAWNCNAEASVAGSCQQLHANPGRDGDSALIWQQHGPALLWSLGAGTAFPMCMAVSLMKILFVFCLRYPPAQLLPACRFAHVSSFRISYFSSSFVGAGAMKPAWPAIRSLSTECIVQQDQAHPVPGICHFPAAVCQFF